MMSFVGRFPSRTEKLNAKVLSDIQCLRAPGKRYLRTWGYRSAWLRDYFTISSILINKIRTMMMVYDARH